MTGYLNRSFAVPGKPNEKRSGYWLIKNIIYKVDLIHIL